MEITCAQCQSKFKIPDEKVPKTQVFTVACPKCKHKISVGPRSEPSAAAPNVLEAVSTSTYDAEDKPFDFVEEGVETALLCEPDPDIRAKIKSDLESMGYHIREPKNPIDALKQMRFHVFDLIVVDELFGTEDPNNNNILKYLERLNMNERRNIFVALITRRFRTNDSMQAFNKSVNAVINVQNTNETQKILKRSISENAAFYRIFREALIKTGRL